MIKILFFLLVYICPNVQIVKMKLTKTQSLKGLGLENVLLECSLINVMLFVWCFLLSTKLVLFIFSFKVYSLSQGCCNILNSSQRSEIRPSGCTICPINLENISPKLWQIVKKKHKMNKLNRMVISPDNKHYYI